MLSPQASSDKIKQTQDELRAKGVKYCIGAYVDIHGVPKAKVVPLGRIGKVEDMVSACLFLLSDEAPFITGTELAVDGGLTARP